MAHEGGVVGRILGADGTGAAEEIAVQAGVGAGFTRDQGGVEIVDPFPDEAVEAARPVEIGRSGGGIGQDGGDGPREPGVKIAVEGFVVFAIRPRVAGGRGELPFGRGGQPPAGPAGIGAGGEPRDPDDGGARRSFRARLKITVPVFQVRGIGEEPADLGSLPLGLGGDESEILGVRNGPFVEQKCGHGDLRWFIERTLQRNVDAGGDEHRASGHGGIFGFQFWLLASGR